MFFMFKFVHELIDISSLEWIKQLLDPDSIFSFRNKRKESSEFFILLNLIIFLKNLDQLETSSSQVKSSFCLISWLDVDLRLFVNSFKRSNQCINAINNSNFLFGVNLLDLIETLNLNVFVSINHTVGSESRANWRELKEELSCHDFKKVESFFSNWDTSISDILKGTEINGGDKFLLDNCVSNCVNDHLIFLWNAEKSLETIVSSNLLECF